MSQPPTSLGPAPTVAGLFSLALAAVAGGCGAPPEDRSEARQRVTAVAESLRAAHAERWGVATREELSRLRTDSVAAAD